MAFTLSGSPRQHHYHPQFAHTVATTWMLSGPSFPGKLPLVLQGAPLGKPSLTAGLLSTPQAPTAPCTWLPRPSGHCEFPTAQ